jgi:CheY-like chemotaxis protein
LRILTTTVPDLMITDVGMPEADGYELLRQVRASANDAVRRLPVAALTAYARSEDRARSLRAGFQMHLAKPIDPAELVAAASALVGRQPA